MSFSGTILQRKAGLLIPESVIKLLLEKNPTFVSSSTVQDGKMDIDGQMTPELGDVMTAQELLKAQDQLLFLGNYPDQFPEDSANPFVVLYDNNNNPILLMYTDGDFSNYHEEKSAHSPDFFAFQKYFKPRIDKWLKKSGNKLSSVVEELKDADVQEDIRNSFVGRAMVVFHSITGDIIPIQNKNADFLQADWGYASNGYGWKPEKVVRQKPSVPETGGVPALPHFLKRNKPADQQVNTEAANDKPAPKSELPAKAEETPKFTPNGRLIKESEAKDTAAAVDVGPKQEQESSLIKLSLTPDFKIGMSKKEKENWYQSTWPGGKYGGPRKPPNYKDGVAHIALVPKAEVADFLAKGWVLKDKDQIFAPAPKQEQGYPAKDVEAKHIKADPKPSVATDNASERGYKSFKSEDFEEGTTLGDFTVEKQKKVMEAFTDSQFLSLGSAALSVSPGKIQSMESKQPSATKIAGLPGLEVVLGWSEAQRNYMFDHHPEWMRLLFTQVLETYIGTMKGEEKITPTSHVKPAPSSNGAPELPAFVRRKAS